MLSSARLTVSRPPTRGTKALTTDGMDGRRLVMFITFFLFHLFLFLKKSSAAQNPSFQTYLRRHRSIIRSPPHADLAGSGIRSDCPNKEPISSVAFPLAVKVRNQDSFKIDT